jgi:hypothetical protein
MSLVAILPFRAAGYVWLALNLVALLATLRLLGRHLVGLPPQDWAVTQLLPALLLAPYWLWEFRLNQIDVLTLLLVVGSFVCWERGRGMVAGFWLGLAVLLKLTPGLLVLWFVLKRETRTVAVAVLTVVLAGPVSDMIAFGPREAIGNYREWANKAVLTGSHRGLILAEREVDWRNQGFGAVLSRWLHPTNYNTHFDNDPQIQAEYVGYEPRWLNVATLPLHTVANITLGVVGATLAGLIWLARRPACRLTLWQLRFEWALFMLAILWMMPVMRRYHMIAALPAIALLGAGLHYSQFRGGWAKLTLVCISLALALEFTLLSIPLEATGTVLASVAILALPLVVMLLRLQRRPTELSNPVFAPAHPARRSRLGDLGAASVQRAVVAHV